VVTQVGEKYSIRECARDLIRLLDANQNNLARAEEAAIPYLQRMLRQSDLLEYGVRREGNHTGESLWLYYDYDLQIMTAKMPLNTTVPVHNHGTWEVVGVYSGAIKYTMYERVDDRSQRFYSDLKVVEDRIMWPPDVSICPPPPHDVHGFTALTDDTIIIAVVGGSYAPTREYYRPGEHYHIERHQQAWRLGGQQGR
jgi:predicted metal-dependent enzyme (double-stranded beta helix superfamily)